MQEFQNANTLDQLERETAMPIIDISVKYPSLQRIVKYPYDVGH